MTLMARKFFSNHPAPLSWGEGEINVVQHRRKRREMPPRDSEMRLTAFEPEKIPETARQPKAVSPQGQPKRAVLAIPVQFDGSDDLAAGRECPIRKLAIAPPDSHSQTTADRFLVIEGDFAESEDN